MSKGKVPSYLVVLTAAVVIDGEIRKRGEQVEVNKAEAENLLYRGRAELVAADDADGDQVIDLGKMKKPELVELATEYGIENPSENTVDELRILIKAAVEKDAE